jgi:hypothetical protein
VATDSAGNISTAASETVTVHPEAPVITNATSTKGQWNLTGTADANDTITVYNGSTKVGTTNAGSTGQWTFNDAGMTSKVDNFTATATDAQSKISPSSGTWIEGTTGKDSFTIASEATLAASHVFGNGGADTIVMSQSQPITLVDADFANVKSVQILQLTGASDVTLGADAATAGILTLLTGSGVTTVTDTAGGTLSVNASATHDNTLLTLSGSTNKASPT